MNKKILLTGILLFNLLLVSMCHAVIAENNYTADNIIATETDASEKITALVENVQVEYDMPVLDLADSEENIVTVTFDLTNTSSRAEEFNIYAAVYKQEETLFSTDIVNRILQSKEKQQILFKVKVPNDGKDTYGKIFVWDNNMQPASEYTPFTVVGSNSTSYPNVTINDNLSLTTNMKYNNLTLNSGYLDLNGHDITVSGNLYFNGGTININTGTLTVNENIIQSAGSMVIGNGSLIANKDYRIQKEKKEYGEITYDYSDGYLNMTHENDRVLVNGDFFMQSDNSHEISLTNGVLELKGNFSQLNYSVSSYHNFDATGNHKVVFSGVGKQHIYFDAPNTSGFNDIEIKNNTYNNIVIDNGMRGWRLRGNFVWNGDLTLNAGTMDLNGHNLSVNGVLYQSGGTININTGTLTVNENIIQSAGSMVIGNGSLIANKDYRIQKEKKEYGEITYDYSDGYLNMTHENDRVLVNGDFFMQSDNGHERSLTNGVLELKGNFSQLNYSVSSYHNFDATGNHKVVFSGVGKQHIYFDEPNTSGFNDIEIKNNTYNNIVIDNGMRGWRLRGNFVWNGDLTLNAGTMDLNGYNLSVNGVLYQSGGTININTGTLTVNENIIQSAGSMVIGNGSLIANRDYRIQKEKKEYGEITYDYSDGYLDMTHENDRVLVNGDFFMQSDNGHERSLTNGVLELKGNFSQLNYSVSSYHNFNATENHKVILSGSGVQNISFESESSQFNILILTKPYETGYTFSRIPCWNTLYQADAVSINYGGQSGAYAPTGNYSREFTDMTIISAAGDMPIKRTYNSQDEESTVFNQGWTLSVSAKLTDEGNGYKQVKLPDGSTAAFKESNGVYESLNSRSNLSKSEDGTYALTSKSQVKYCFSSDGKIISMSDRYGNTTSFETNSDGNITALIEPSGKRYSLSYSGKLLTGIKDETSGATVSYGYTNGRLTSAVNPAGVNIYYEYDNNGRLTKILDHDRNTVETIAYNSDNKVDYVIDADGNKSTYAYDLADGKTTITDSNGKQKIQWYDSSFNVTKNQDPEGGITATEYNMTAGLNKYNEPRAVTDRNGRNTYYERDSRGNITKQSNPDGSYKLFEYDDNNNITGLRDENGNYTYYIYDDTETKLLKQVKPLDGVSRYSDTSDKEQFAITEYTYYDDEYKIKGLVKSKTEPEGLISEFSYDDNGMLASVKVTDTKDGTVGTTEYKYNKSGLLEYEISPNGYKTTYEYDNAGNPTKIAADNGKAVSVIQYDAAGRKVKEISPNEYAENGINASGYSYLYYPSGRIRTETDSLGNVTEYTYDLYGNIKTVTNPDGSAYKYEYDGIGRKTKEYFKDRGGADFVVTYEYSYAVNSAKNSETTETAYLNADESIITVNEYDYGERLLRQIYADGTEISKEYDGKGNVKTETDANGNTKEYFYNAFDNVIREKIPFDGNYQYKKYNYDKSGNCIREEITNQASGSAEDYSITEHTYNSRGLLIATAAYDNNIIKSAAQFVYDSEGNKVRVYTGLLSPLTINGIDDVSENGDSDYSVRKYEYDYSGNITKSVDAMGFVESYAYDGNGNRTAYTDKNGNNMTYKYDAMNHLTEKSAGNSRYTYKYDASGNKTAVFGDYRADYTYDGKHNLIREETGVGVKEYIFDLQGNRIGFGLSLNGNEKINLGYKYDNMGRVSQVVSGETVIADYSYDNNGNISEVDYDNGGKTIYSYNKANLVTNVSNSAFDNVISEFDYTYYMDGRQKTKSDNSIIENYVYDDLGRLIADNYASYEYDDYSNRIRMNDTAYAYDKNGRLIGDNFSYDNNGSLLSDGENNYRYDIWNRLIAANGETYSYDDLNGRVGVDSGVLINDGMDIVYTSDGVSETVYLNGLNPIAFENSEGRQYYFFNAHGDTVNIINNSGIETRSYSYDSFGTEKNPDLSDFNPIRYSGQYFNANSKNYYSNSRYYNTETGRFLSQDSYYGDDEDILSLNQYTYCYNDPIQYVDLSGNSVISAAKAIAADSLRKAGKDMLKSYLKDQYSSAIGINIEDKDYFGEFTKNVGKNAAAGTGKQIAKKLGISTEYSVFEPIIESGIKNVAEEFNASQKENRDFSIGNAVGETAAGVVLSYVKSAPGVGTVYDMCLDLNNGDIFKNLMVKKVTKAVDIVADSMGYEPVNWNAGKDLYKTNTKQFNNDYNSFKSKGWSSNTSYWYALSQSLSRKVSRGNSWLRKNGYIK